MVTLNHYIIGNKLVGYAAEGVVINRLQQLDKEVWDAGESEYNRVGQREEK